MSQYVIRVCSIHNVFLDVFINVQMSLKSLKVTELKKIYVLFIKIFKLSLKSQFMRLSLNQVWFNLSCFWLLENRAVRENGRRSTHA